MGFALKGFLTGAAAAVSEKLDVDQKQAEETGKLSALNLHKIYEENKKKNEIQIKEATDNINTLRAYFPNASEAQLVAASTNKGVMEGFSTFVKDRNFDATKFSIDNIVKVSDTAPSGKKAEEMIRSAYDKQNVAPAVAIPEGLGFFRTRQAEIQQQAFERSAKALGVKPEVLRGVTTTSSTPDFGITAEYNMSLFNKQKDFSVQKNEAMVRLQEAKASGDPTKIALASEDAIRFKMTEEAFLIKDKTEPQIQSELISKITEAGKSKNTKLQASLTAELRQRQTLARLPGEGQEKITQSNLIVIASKAVTAAVGDALPPGSFVITQNQDGSTTLAPKATTSAKLYKDAIETGRKAVIKEMTDPRTGLPLSEMHRNALISIGVGFDQNGKPTSEPPTTGTPAPAATTPAAAPTRTVPAAAAPAANLAPTTPARPLVWNRQTGNWE
jgi:hypothetical protein